MTRYNWCCVCGNSPCTCKCGWNMVFSDSAEILNLVNPSRPDSCSGCTGPTGATGPTGPTGPTGATGTADTQLLSAYSTPSAPGTAGNALLFDQNGASSGSGITHTPGSSDFTVADPGIYSVAFHGNLAPASGVNFPLNVILELQQNGTVVPGAVVQHTFHTSPDTATVGFSIPVEVSSTPSTFRVVGEGGNFIYSEVTMTLYKVAETSL